MSIPSVPRHITLATDLSARSDRAYDRAMALARDWQAQIQIVHAVEAFQYAYWSQGPSWRRYDPVAVAQRKLAREYPDWPAAGASLIVKNGDAYDLVTSAALDSGSELLVTGIAHDETYGADKLGRMVVELVKNGPAPVLVVKGRAHRPYQRIVLASDLSEVSRRAIGLAVAAFPEAQFTLFHAFDFPYKNQIDDMASVERELRAREMDRAREWLRESIGSKADSVGIVAELGKIASNLAKYVADKEAELVVVGSSGRSGLAAVLVGSVAIESLEQVDCDVLAVRQQ
jgi:nucleotide-binding universal stress UspA family protein